MKIIYAISGLGICGGVRIVFEHANRLAALGHDISILSIASDAYQDWFPLKDVKISSFHSSYNSILNADVLVATDWNSASFVNDSKTKARKFYFVQMRESLFTNHANWKNEAEATYKFPLQPLTISYWLREFLVLEYKHQNVPIIPNGVNFDMFYPDPVYPKIPGITRILIEGHEINAAKNIRDAHGAVEMLRTSGEKIEVWGFNQIGEGRYNYDKFLYQPSQDIIRQLYSSSDILLKTSRFEGRNCSVVEAMACGCAVVATQCKGIDDLHNEFNCLLVDYGDIISITSAVSKIIHNEDLKDSLIGNAYDYVRSNLKWDNIIPKLEAVYGRH